jgi:uncharacterized membrane protein YoaT (DUF817 family)
LPSSGVRGVLVEFTAFVLKQAWACVFGALLLVVLLATRLWYPENAALARNDFLTLAAVGIQAGMVAARLETLRELRVILLFHVVGTAMELFKTDVGSWVYEGDGVLRLGGVPLFSGFMYAAVGSYLVRVYPPEQPDATAVLEPATSRGSRRPSRAPRPGRRNPQEF